MRHRGPGHPRRVAQAAHQHAPITNPAATAAVLAKDKAFFIFTSGHHRYAQGECDDPLPLAARALAGFGGLGLRLNSNDTLTAACRSTTTTRRRCRLAGAERTGARTALGWQVVLASRFWDEVISYEATAFVYIGEICDYLLNQPPKPTDRAHKVRVIGGNGCARPSGTSSPNASASAGSVSSTRRQ